jgi:RNA polymerase sigma-70 factor (ECF subfamily)
MLTTSLSLLQQLRRSGDARAWQRFVELYTPLLFRWGKRLGLQDQDAADLAQDVLILLVQKLPEFEYDRQRSFRAWLWTVTQNKWRENRRRLRSVQANPSDALAELADSDPALVQVQAEYDQYLAARALQIMRSEFQPTTWQACWEVVARGRPVAEVAAELHMSVGAVYVARSRVLQRVRQVLHELQE